VTFEWNNTPSEATPLSLGTRIETQLSPPKDIMDNFSLPAVKDRYYAFTLTPTGGGVYLGGTLIPTTGQRVSLFTPTGYAAGTTAYGEVHPSTDGTSIFQFSQSGSSLYDFVVYPSTADGLVHDPVTYEPNNTLHTAAPIALGDDISATVNTTDDSVDFFPGPGRGKRSVRADVLQQMRDWRDLPFGVGGRHRNHRQYRNCPQYPEQDVRGHPVGRRAVRGRTRRVRLDVSLFAERGQAMRPLARRSACCFLPSALGRATADTMNPCV
jgi:hypothetical protein